jgi:LppP/LprE lipoprotein
MRNAIVVGVMLFSAVTTVQVELSAQARWLDQPLKSWHQPAAGVPMSSITADGHATLERRCGSPTSASPGVVDAIRRARWVPFLHLDQAIAGNDIQVLGGMTGATPDCEPLYFNLFVFAGGVFAGTVSPVIMAPTRDGAAGAVRLTGPDTLTVEFARFMPGDADCCPSLRLRVSYRIDKSGVGPSLVPTDALQIR